MQGAEKVAKWLTNKTGIEIIADVENLIVPSLAPVCYSGCRNKGSWRMYRSGWTHACDNRFHSYKVAKKDD